MILWLLLLAQDPRAAFDRGDYPTAIRLFEAANQKKPECTNSLYIGLARYRLKQVNEALIAFRTAVQCDPKLAAGYLALGDAYAARGNDGEALTAYLQVLQLQPKEGAALRAAATLYLKAGLHREAQPLLEALVTATPKSVDARTDLGAVLAASGNKSGAEEQFRQALALDANYYPALTGLGNLLARAGESEQALPLLRRAVTARAKGFEGHFLLGSALNRADQFEEARRELELAVTYGGGMEPQVYYQLARALGGLGKAAERRQALAKFSELTKKEKEDSELQRQAARLVDEARGLLQKGDLAGAAQKLELAREAKPGDATLLFRLAGLNFDLGRLDVAREYAQAAISISPTTWLYHFLLGLVEQSASRLADARASLEMATQLNPNEAPAWNALGEVLLAQGNRAAAITPLERAVTLAPGEARFRENLARAKQ